MKTKVFGSLILILILIVTNARAEVRATSSVQVSNVDISDRTLNMLDALAKQYKVVIGVYGVLIGSDHQTVHITFNRATLKEVLDAIVRQDTRFEWTENRDGSVHFSLRTAPMSLLNERVHSFDTVNPQRAEIVGLLTHIPEVDTWLGNHGCSMGEMIAGPLSKNWGKFSVHVKDQSLLSVLDTIAAKSHTYYWSAIQYSTAPCDINVVP
jgi:hypothetical protein